MSSSEGMIDCVGRDILLLFILIYRGWVERNTTIKNDSNAPTGRSKTSFWLLQWSQTVVSLLFTQGKGQHTRSLMHVIKTIQWKRVWKLHNNATGIQF